MWAKAEVSQRGMCSKEVQEGKKKKGHLCFIKRSEFEHVTHLEGTQG